MKLLLIFTLNVSLNDWERSGIIEREIQIYKKLSQKDVKISFLTYGDNSDLKYSKTLKEIEIIPVNNKNKKEFSFLKCLLFPIFNYKLFKDFDIIKTNQMNGSWLTWSLRILFRKKIIIRCGFEAYKIALFEYKNSNKSKKLKFRLIKIFLSEWISYRLANSIIISNNFEREFIISRFRINPKKISVLSNNINTDLFRPIPIDKKEKHVLFIGSLNQYKNLDNLIESFQILENFSLDIIGDGLMKNELKEKINKLDLQSRVSFLGVIKNSKLPEYINKYPLFILPSHTEGNPKALLEAMSCGIPCIGSKIPGITQIIKHKKNGYLCKTDIKSIASAIKIVYENTKLRKILGENARDYVLDNCSLNKMSEREYNIYKLLYNKS